MTALTLPAPAPPEVGDDDWIHGICCDPDVALCGADVSAAAEVAITSLDGVCPACVAIADLPLPCGTPGCPGRDTT